MKFSYNFTVYSLSLYFFIELQMNATTQKIPPTPLTSIQDEGKRKKYEITKIQNIFSRTLNSLKK